MNREMVVFGSLTVMLGAVLFTGLHLEPEPARLQVAQSHEMAPADVPPPSSHAPVAVGKERKNPFAPPIEIKPIAQPKPIKPPVDTNAPPPPPPPPPTSTVVKPQPKTITDWSPAEIPVGFAGLIALPGQPAEAHLTAKDGSTMVVHVGDEIKSLGVKIVDITATDVTVEVDDRRASLRDLIQKNNTAGGATGTSGATPPAGNLDQLLKKLTGGGGFDPKMLQGLTPEQLKQLQSDPAVKKMIEQYLQNAQQNPPANDGNRPRPGTNGGNGGGNGGGNRGGRGNRGGNGNDRGGEGRGNGAAPLQMGVEQ